MKKMMNYWSSSGASLEAPCEMVRFVRKTSFTIIGYNNPYVEWVTDDALDGLSPSTLS